MTLKEVQSQSQFWDVASADASPAAREVQQLITTLLRPEDWTAKQVLDGGCGNGDYSAAFITLGAAKVTGIDVSAGSLATARQKAPQGIFEQASLSELPYSNATFDVVWSWGVLHYVPNPEKAIAEVGRVLKPGGVAVIHTLGTNTWSAIELSLQQVFSHSPDMVKAALLTTGSTLIPLITQMRTGKRPEAITSKSVRQKLQERLLVPGKQRTFTQEALITAFGSAFRVERGYPPVSDLLRRDMSLTVIARKQHQ